MPKATKPHGTVHGKFGLGVKPDKPDFRDTYYKNSKYKRGLSIPNNVDWRSRIEAPWDQGQIGSCVSHGVGSLIKYVYPNLMPSRLKIYYDGRVIENTVRIDSGLEIRDGIKAVVYGVCPEAMWPYVETKFKNKPAAACYTSKNERYITEYARVGYNSDPASILDEMLNCLTQGSPIVFGATLYESFESDTVAKSGIVPMPTTREKTLGGHCMAVYGFDKAKKLFTVRNSWGHTDWGDKGYCYIPFDYLINTDLCSDMWMITK